MCAYSHFLRNILSFRPHISLSLSLSFFLAHIQTHRYVTEKIINAFVAGAVPIYLGDDSVTHIFDPASFIHVNRRELLVSTRRGGTTRGDEGGHGEGEGESKSVDIDSAVERVIELALDRVRLKAMQRAPILRDDVLEGAAGGAVGGSAGALFSWLPGWEEDEGEEEGEERERGEEEEEMAEGGLIEKGGGGELGRRVRSIAAHHYVREALGVERLFAPFPWAVLVGA